MSIGVFFLCLATKMNLPDRYKDYKVTNIQEGSRHFFALNSAYSWDFQHYFEETHQDLNKSKKIQEISRDYDSDLNWITQLQETPICIKEYATSLLKQKKVYNLPYIQKN